MNGEHRPMREALGAHVLGHLPESEDAAVRAHLDGCADCRAEVADLASVLPALRGVDPAALDATPVPPPDLGARIVERARSERRRRPSGRALAVAAAAALAVAAGGAGYLLGAAASEAGPREPVTVQALAPGVEAAAVAIPHTWGVEISLEADGFAPGQVYRAVVRDDAGRAVSAGEFIGTGEAAMRCNLNSSVLRSNASGFEVVDGGGAVVVRGEL